MGFWIFPSRGGLNAVPAIRQAEREHTRHNRPSEESPESSAWIFVKHLDPFLSHILPANGGLRQGIDELKDLDSCSDSC